MHRYDGLCRCALSQPVFQVTTTLADDSMTTATAVVGTLVKYRTLPEIILYPALFLGAARTVPGSKYAALNDTGNDELGRVVLQVVQAQTGVTSANLNYLLSCILVGIGYPAISARPVPCGR